MISSASGSLGQLLSTPLVLPATLAGALAALAVVVVIAAWRRSPASGVGLVLPLGILVIGVLALALLIERMAASDQAAARRALLARDTELSRAALAPGSALSCLDARAGETVENACEKAVFADARSAAAAVAYTAARIDLLLHAAAIGAGADEWEAYSATRRAIELDRFGVAAHVLATRHGCTADNCAVFAILTDTGALQSNLKARVFDQYVARHAPQWEAVPAPSGQPAVSEGPSDPTSETASAQPAPGHVPLSDKYDFPSADSIPPVSIMNAEPPLPAGSSGATSAQAADTRSAGPSTQATPPPPPAPRPKPVQTQAAPPPAR